MSDINQHRSLDINHLEDYSTERNRFFVDRTENTANLSLLGGKGK